MKSTCRNGCFGKGDVHLVHTIPNHHSTKNGCSPKIFFFKSSLLLNGWWGIQVRPPNNSDDLFLLFCLCPSSSLLPGLGCLLEEHAGCCNAEDGPHVLPLRVPGGQSQEVLQRSLSVCLHIRVERFATFSDFRNWTPCCRSLIQRPGIHILYL